MAHGGARPGAGKKKGHKSGHTLDALAVKQLYIERAREFAEPILQALVAKALTGDVPAIKEFNDRAYGKAPQAITGEAGKPLVVVISGETASRYDLT